MIKNIIFFNDFGYVNGGASKVAIDTAIGLALRGYNITYICGVGPICEDLNKKSIKVICLSDKGNWKNNIFKSAIKAIWNKELYNKAIKELENYNNKETIACIHYISKILSPSVFKVLSDLRIKGIFTLHSYYTCPNEAFYNYKTGKLCTLKPLSIKCIFCNCDANNYFQKVYRCIRQLSINYNLRKNTNISFFAVSNLEKNILLKNSNQQLKGIKVIHNPVDINKDEKLKISSNNKYIFIGRLSEEKGITDFCEALQELNLKGIVLGNGVLMNELNSKYSNITFAGWVDSKNMKAYYDQAKCLIFPSKVPETFGLSIVEALSYGIPCIIPSKCGAIDIIINGKNGYVYEIGSYNSLIKAIKQFENSDLRTIENYIKNDNSPQEFTIDQYIYNFEQILKNT